MINFKLLNDDEIKNLVDEHFTEYDLQFAHIIQQALKDKMENDKFVKLPDEAVTIISELNSRVNELEEIITSWELKSIERESNLDIANKEIEKLSFKLEAYVNGNLSACDTLLDNGKQLAKVQLENERMREALTRIALGNVYDAEIIELAGDTLVSLATVKGK